jgi:hypothetical protein
MFDQRTALSLAPAARASAAGGRVIWLARRLHLFGTICINSGDGWDKLFYFFNGRPLAGGKWPKENVRRATHAALGRSVEWVWEKTERSQPRGIAESRPAGGASPSGAHVTLNDRHVFTCLTDCLPLQQVEGGRWGGGAGWTLFFFCGRRLCAGHQQIPRKQQQDVHHLVSSKNSFGPGCPRADCRCEAMNLQGRPGGSTPLQQVKASHLPR